LRVIGKLPGRKNDYHLSAIIVIASMTKKIKILFLAANPLDSRHRFLLDEEFREISEKIQNGTDRDSFELISEWAVRSSDLQKALLRHRPHIVHFSGRGNETEGIVLEDNLRKSKLVNKQAVANLFKILKDNILVVVLNGCYVKNQATELSKTIDCTIGMNTIIEHEAAVVFAAHFYQSLAFGRSVKAAFDLAVNELELEAIKGVDIPELLERNGVDASRSFLITSDQAPFTPESHDDSNTGNDANDRISPRGKHNTIYSFLTWLFATISAGAIIESVARFASSEGDWLRTISTVLQFILAILAAILVAVAVASLIQPNPPLVAKAVYLGTVKGYRIKRAAILTVIVMFIALGVRLWLPSFARFYYERGFEYQTQGNLSWARKSYQRALRLNPSYTEAHYNLATICEDLQPQEAIKEYLLAIKYDSNLYPAYNNLARLYILWGNDKDYNSALQLLNQALELSPSDERVQYSLYKNLGWANYILKNHEMAENYLRRAISLRKKGDAAAAHCLLVYVLKEQNKPGVIDACKNCVRFAPGEPDVEAKWVNDAREQLMKGASQ
jgi:tetratricopeptide (TPR) repeat protein